MTVGKFPEELVYSARTAFLRAMRAYRIGMIDDELMTTAATADAAATNDDAVFGFVMV